MPNTTVLLVCGLCGLVLLSGCLSSSPSKTSSWVAYGEFSSEHSQVSTGSDSRLSGYNYEPVQPKNPHNPGETIPLSIGGSDCTVSVKSAQINQNMATFTIELVNKGPNMVSITNSTVSLVNRSGIPYIPRQLSEKSTGKSLAARSDGSKVVERAVSPDGSLTSTYEITCTVNQLSPGTILVYTLGNTDTFWNL